MKVLVTGGCGFIGKNFIRLLRRERPQWEVVNLDALTYAGTARGLPDVGDAGYRFIHGDVRDSKLVREAVVGCDAVVHFAAESHVDRSIMSSAEFVSTNVLGTQVLLDATRQGGASVYLQVSTDEVYGSLSDGDAAFSETTPIAPRSPYSASKAAADHLVLSYFHTHGMDVRVTRCSNNYGPYQFPEKLIPLTLINALHERPIPVYGDGRQRRDWIHVEDHCRGVLAVLEEGRGGEVYNIGADQEQENLDTILAVLSTVGASEELITYVRDRPGHDRRYAMDSRKIRAELGWAPRYTFETGIRETVQWYLQAKEWWQPILDGTYRDYYQAQYGAR